jgi:hypothetical protein
MLMSELVNPPQAQPSGRRSGRRGRRDYDDDDSDENEGPNRRRRKKRRTPRDSDTRQSESLSKAELTKKLEGTYCASRLFKVECKYRNCRRVHAGPCCGKEDCPGALKCPDFNEADAMAKDKEVRRKLGLGPRAPPRAPFRGNRNR